MRLALAGISHKTAPVELRERVAFDAEQARRALSELLEDERIAEAMLLSTCNRTELCARFSVGFGPDPDFLVDFIIKIRGLSSDEIRPNFYRLVGQEAVGHLFEVASGLDSMVIGETQITNQFKQAYALSVSQKATGPLINRMCHRAFEVAKDVRSKTGLSVGNLSVSAVACELAEKIFRNLIQCRVLLIGAGETGTLVATHLEERGVAHLSVSNRTLERAQELAEKLGATAVPFEERLHYAKDADILITAVGGEEHIVKFSELQAVIGTKKTPLFIIDLGVPRNVESRCADIVEVFLYNIDDIEEIVQKNLTKRQVEAAKAKKIVDDATEEFMEWYRKQLAGATIGELHEQLDQIRIKELEKYRYKLDAASFEIAEKLTRSIVKKIFNLPISTVKRAAKTEVPHGLLQAIRELFGLGGNK